MEPPADEWTAAVNRGDYASAWAKSDAVLARRMVRGEECRTWPRHLQYIWKGESLAGKRILVRCYTDSQDRSSARPGGLAARTCAGASSAPAISEIHARWR